MTRETGTIRERIFQALIKRYTADQEEALVKIDALLRGDVVPGHYALTEDIDKLLGKAAEAAGNIKATLWHKLGSRRGRRGVAEGSQPTPQVSQT